MLVKETLYVCECVSFMSGCFVICSHLEICLQKGSVLCISQRVSLQSSMRGGGAFTLSVVDVDLTSVGNVVLVGLHVLLLVWMAGLPWLDVTNTLIEAVGSWRVLEFYHHEKESAALLQAHDIHSNVML